MPLDLIAEIHQDWGSGAGCFDRGWSQGLMPEPDLWLHEWADAYRVLTSDSSAEPGVWRTSRTPYLAEIMEALSSRSPVQEIVLIAGAQLGKTETGNNWIGYIIDQVPGPVMAVQPTLDLAKRWSRQRLAKMLSSASRLTGKVSEVKSRDGGNTMLLKEFPGGIIVIAGANSAPGLRSMPVRYLFLDEVDAYPESVGNEGDPADLAVRRTATFMRRKVFKTSTPLIRGRSRIERDFLASTRGYYHVPCPYCRKTQKLVWERIKWDGNTAKNVRYICEHCGAAIKNHQKTWMLDPANGAGWVHELPKDGRALGFHISSLYSPVGWFSWEDAVRQFLNAGTDTLKLKVFTNTVLGLTWADEGEAPDWEKLYLRRGPYRTGEVPWGVVFITAGIDVQANRIEMSIYGWGEGKRSWLIDHIIVVGDTDSKAVWAELDKHVCATYQHPCGAELRIAVAAIDTGYRTNRVYEWVRASRSDRKIAPVRGVASLLVSVAIPKKVDVRSDGTAAKTSILRWNVGPGVIKSYLYGCLRQSLPANGGEDPDGYCRHPENMDAEFFQQLASEHLVVDKKGEAQWQKLRDRNEALDCFVYAYAAAVIVGIERFKANTWKNFRQAQGIVLSDADQTSAPLDLTGIPRRDVPTAEEPVQRVPRQNPTGPTRRAAPRGYGLKMRK